MLPDLAAKLRGDWEGYFPGYPRPDRVSFLNVTGALEGGTTTFLAFGRGATSPIFAVKVARDRDAGGKLRRESETLRTLSECGPDVSATVPRVILCEAFGRHEVMVLSIVPGGPIPVRYGTDGQVDLDAAAIDLRAASRWLSAMNLATRRTDEQSLHALRRRLLSVANRFREGFDLSVRESAALVRAVDNLEGVVRAGAFVQHGDFTRQNILIREAPPHSISAVSVIDWTFAASHGTALHDLLFLCIGYFLQLRSEPGVYGLVGAFRRCVIEATPAHRLIHELLREHCETLNIDPSSSSDYILWFLIERVVFDFDAMAQCVANGKIPRWVLSLAAESQTPFGEIARQQFWFACFKTFITEQQQAAA